MAAPPRAPTRLPRSLDRVVKAVPRDPLQFLDRLHRQQGDVGRFPMGWRDLVSFLHPEDVHEVLVAQNASFRGLNLARPLLDRGILSADGEQHRAQRAMLRPAFHHRRIERYAEVAAAAGQRWAATWHDGQRVDMAEEMMQLTLDVTGQLLLGGDHATEARALGEALTHSLEVFRDSPLAPWTARLPTPTSVRFRRTRVKVDALMMAAIAEWRAHGAGREDLLAMLMESRDAEGRGYTDKEVRDEALTLLVAGHETTALSLTWTWHHLAEHPAAQARLHEEIDAVLGGEPPKVEDVPKLTYARKCLAEALRLHPPVWAIGRRAVEEVRVRDTAVRKGSVVVVSPFLTQRDARWWGEPEHYEPERFTPEAQKARPKYAYFPFGGGPRVCLGEQLAWMEATLLLAALAQRWQVRPEPGTPVERQPLLTLQPRRGLPLRVAARAK